MTQPLVDKIDVETALLRPLTTVEARYIGGLIRQAEAQLRVKRPTVDERIALFATTPTDPAALDPEAVRAMLAGVIKKYMVNPEGAASKSEASGPFQRTTAFASYGKSLAGGVQGSLVVTDDDLKKLEPQSVARLGSIRLRPALAPGVLERRVRR